LPYWQATSLDAYQHIKYTSSPSITL